MKRVGFLFGQVVSFENLVRAVKKAARGKKAKSGVAQFVLDYEREVIELQAELTENRYQPLPYNQFTIFEPKERKICGAHFRDRVVHHAICGVIEPIFERRLIQDSYACRRGKGAHLALKRCQGFTRKYGYFLKCDISKYFESIDHGVLQDLLVKMFKDRRLLGLLQQIIEHGVPGAESGKGLPIGNLTSQHFANLYLGELDHFVKERLRVPGYLRYMDDFVCFHDSKKVLSDTLDRISHFVESVLRLKLKEKATILAPVSEGIPFLGFRAYSGLIRVQRKNLVRMRLKIRAREKAFQKGLIEEKDLILSLNSVVAHISHADTTELRRKEVLRSLKMA